MNAKSLRRSCGTVLGRPKPPSRAVPCGRYRPPAKELDWRPGVTIALQVLPGVLKRLNNGLRVAPAGAVLYAKHHG